MLKTKPIVRWTGGKTSTPQTHLAAHPTTHEVTPIVTRAQCANQRTHSGKKFDEIIIRRRIGRAKMKSARDSHALPLAA